MAEPVSTRVQLRRAPELDQDGALAYRWRKTTAKRRGRRSWTEGVLLASETEGVTRVGPERDGFEAAVAALADVRQLAGGLPVLIDLRFDQLPAENGFQSWPLHRRSRYDRPDRRGETLGERAARLRQQDGEA